MVSGAAAHDAKVKVILDTDIGGDIDDALALAYLLAHERCDLLGVTTVGGGAHAGARMASALCTHAVRDVPIQVGLERPLVIERPYFPERLTLWAPQAPSIAPWPHRREFERGNAIEWMRQMIRSHPGEVTLLAIGPLTNVAVLFATDPEIPSLLGSLVLMGGEFTTLHMAEVFGPMREFNVICDPHAAAMVFRDAPDGTRVLGLDVTFPVTLPADEVRTRFDAELLRPVMDFAAGWFADDMEFGFHDPIAAAAIFDEDLVTFRPGRVEVDLSDGTRQGATRWTHDPAGPLRAGFDIDQEAFFDSFLKAFV
jgi:purine nucleosidase